MTVFCSLSGKEVEQQLTTNNSTDIVMDKVDNIMSFETPVVVFISSSLHGTSRFYYNICTRARVSLVLIDVYGYTYFDDSNNIDTVKWKPDNNNDNTFIK